MVFWKVPIAQLVERRSYTADVGGSSPSRNTKQCGALAACWAHIPKVGGSIPPIVIRK
jgi:hypothetical protein